MIPTWLVDMFLDESLPAHPHLAAMAVADGLAEAGFEAQVRGRIAYTDIIAYSHSDNAHTIIRVAERAEHLDIVSPVPLPPVIPDGVIKVDLQRKTFERRPFNVQF